MIRRYLVFLAVAFSLVTGSAAWAQSAAAKAAVDAAKAQGLVGEQGDGYLGFVAGSPSGALKAAVDEINAGRAKAYQDIAAKTGASQAAAGEATAQQLFARLPAGYYYRPLGGAWTRK
jgi:uncharacterized protein YdbL (DUF1318 family)